MVVARSAPALVLLAADRRPIGFELATTIPVDHPRRGAVAIQVDADCWRRAEPGPDGPLVLEVRHAGASAELRVWGPAGTPSETAEGALLATAGWAGFLDAPPADFTDLVSGQPLLRQLVRRLGTPRLPAIPRAFEALGRGILGQLVQGVEGQRSMRQLAALAGEAASTALWTWPEPQRLGRMPAWELRRCGIALKSAQALHAACITHARLEAAAKSADWHRLDALLRALPGVGAWTSAETRLGLGDPDAVSIGDYNLPSMVGSALAGSGSSGTGPQGRWTDADMLALLAPYTGQRARVIALLMRGAQTGLHRYPPRRAPRAALSAHRYW